jgi:peroxiredoxin Q/BCP
MRLGDPAPDFQLPDQDGNLCSLSDLVKDGPIVLFFYPKAFTPGCTAENCSFRDNGQEIEAFGAKRVGISADTPSTQKKFADHYRLDYLLLSDVNKEVAKAYGVKRPGPLFNKRETFVIDKDKKIAAIIKSELNMSKHVDEALKVLKELATSGQ